MTASAPGRQPELAGLRRPLGAGALAPPLARLGVVLAVVDEIDSTNAELVRLARGVRGSTGLPVRTDRGAAVIPPGGVPASDPVGELASDPVVVLVAERQSAGRGRMDRSWQSAVGAGLMVSVLVRPSVATRWLGWLPLVVGTSLVRTLRSYARLPAVLKWPNDLQVDGEKLGGILVELAPGPGVPPAAVIGFGLNVTALADELPERSTSLLLRDVEPALLDRGRLLTALLTDLVGTISRWEQAPDEARGEYREVCTTLGRLVRVELPDGTSVRGTATDVDEFGRLVVDGRAFSAADVIHLR
ncbi:BirA family transcriptional regulator, biotin operon repressor / biotin-[acetyl-CoA-carboxylase] ligase [Parafrankia irregularis]|uniref:biotin--[biotin carboxyl-carrier protein] ligase n=1 Tax=Parafrankia irregularis TaxID=795642 RepID=A0A0S4QG54_9ACTN|nr:MULTISPECIES: biotin--[acetyl-CoA-carboxylase] ligase [Parafrankia]CUU54461.1 BirA family transcriptional regulator, biotin operon repressor / biotin-[acetyl-CoA-carboxylase] ligase [Parafrankia irregularis]